MNRDQSQLHGSDDQLQNVLLKPKYFLPFRQYLTMVHLSRTIVTLVACSRAAAVLEAGLARSRSVQRCRAYVIAKKSTGRRYHFNTIVKADLPPQNAKKRARMRRFAKIPDFANQLSAKSFVPVCRNRSCASFTRVSRPEATDNALRHVFPVSIFPARVTEI